MNEETHAAAVIAALNTQLAAQFAPDVMAYELDDLVELTQKPAQHIEVTLGRRFNEEGSRVSTDKGIALVRVTTRYVADTVTNARSLRAAAKTALEDVRLVVDGSATTPIKFETAVHIEQDEKHWWTGVDSWTYAH